MRGFFRMPASSVSFPAKVEPWSSGGAGGERAGVCMVMASLRASKTESDLI